MRWRPYLFKCNNHFEFYGICCVTNALKCVILFVFLVNVSYILSGLLLDQFEQEHHVVVSFITINLSYPYTSVVHCKYVHIECVLLDIIVK